MVNNAAEGAQVAASISLFGTSILPEVTPITTLSPPNHTGCGDALHQPPSVVGDGATDLDLSRTDLDGGHTSPLAPVSSPPVAGRGAAIRTLFVCRQQLAKSPNWSAPHPPVCQADEMRRIGTGPQFGRGGRRAVLFDAPRRAYFS